MFKHGVNYAPYPNLEKAMNVTLVPCNRETDKDLFFKNLGLLTIWCGEHSHHLVESYKYWLETPDETGQFFKIVSDECVIGITGYWLIDDVSAGLRWHGIIPLFQKSGAGSTALQLLIKELPANVKQLHELTITKKPQAFFKNNDFKLNTNPEDIVKVIKSSGGDDYVSLLTYEVEPCNAIMETC